jgi:hypothetical protein
MFKKYPVKQSQVARALKRQARKYDLSPDSLNVYPSKNVSLTVRVKLVSKSFNSFAIPYRLSFSLKAWDKPFNYQGVFIKRYDLLPVISLLGIERDTLYYWINKGIFPAPIMVLHGVKDKQYWFYHQVQPMYVWYHHMKARGISRIDTKGVQEDIKALKRLQLSQERRWFKRLGIEHIDAYTQKAGKFGVIWLTEDE